MYCTPPFPIVFTLFSSIPQSFVIPTIHRSYLVRPLSRSPSSLPSLARSRCSVHLHQIAHRICSMCDFMSTANTPSITVHSGHNLFSDGAGEWWKSEHTECAAIFSLLGNRALTNPSSFIYNTELWGEESFTFFGKFIIPFSFADSFIRS